MAERTKRRGSMRIARLMGVDIRVHWSFLGLVVLVVWGSGGTAQVFSWLLWIVVVFASVLVHELAHCVVGRRRGAVVQDILLLPIGGVSEMQEMPEEPVDELAIAIVGPLTSFALGLLAFAAALCVHAHVWPPTLFGGAWLARVAWLNLVLFAFNLLPALPMDGGRVLRAALARRRGRAEATRITGRIARAIAVAMMIGGFLFDLWFVFIGFFVYLGATAEEQMLRGSAKDRAHGGSPEPPSPHATSHEVIDVSRERSDERVPRS